jgi:hypothetical protein
MVTEAEVGTVLTLTSTFRFPNTSSWTWAEIEDNAARTLDAMTEIKTSGNAARVSANEAKQTDAQQTAEV